MYSLQQTSGLGVIHKSFFDGKGPAYQTYAHIAYKIILVDGWQLVNVKTKLSSVI